METPTLLKNNLNKVIIFLCTLFFSGVVFAQDTDTQVVENTTSTKTTTTTEWYTDPMYLIAGAAVIIIIIALLSRARNKE